MGELSWITPESPNCLHTAVARGGIRDLCKKSWWPWEEIKKSRVKMDGFEDGGRGYEPRKENIIASDSSKGPETACY